MKTHDVICILQKHDCAFPFDCIIWERIFHTRMAQKTCYVGKKTCFDAMLEAHEAAKQTKADFVKNWT